MLKASQTYWFSRMPHIVCALGIDAANRQTAHREMFRYEFEPGMVDDVRQATNGNFALGTSRFAEQVAVALGRRVVRGKAGRPFKQDEPVSRSLF